MSVAAGREKIGRLRSEEAAFADAATDTAATDSSSSIDAAISLLKRARTGADRLVFGAYFAAILAGEAKILGEVTEAGDSS